MKSIGNIKVLHTRPETVIWKLFLLNFAEKRCYIGPFTTWVRRRRGQTSFIKKSVIFCFYNSQINVSSSKTFFLSRIPFLIIPSFPDVLLCPLANKIRRKRIPHTIGCHNAHTRSWDVLRRSWQMALMNALSALLKLRSFRNYSVYFQVYFRRWR